MSSSFTMSLVRAACPHNGETPRLGHPSPGVMTPQQLPGLMRPFRDAGGEGAA